MLIPPSLCSEFYVNVSRAVDVYLDPKGKTRVDKLFEMTMTYFCLLGL